jgi:uncharacterized repeat protein (TIGR01451 family)
MRRRRFYGWLIAASSVAFTGAAFVWSLERSDAETPSSLPTSSAPTNRLRGPLPIANPPIFSDAERHATSRVPSDSPQLVAPKNELPAQGNPNNTSSVRIGFAVSSDPTGDAPAGPTSRGAQDDRYAAAPQGARFTDYPVRRASSETPVAAPPGDARVPPNPLPPTPTPAAMPNPYAPIGGASPTPHAAPANPLPTTASPMFAAGAKPTSTATEGTGRPGEKALEGLQQPTLVLEKLAPPEIQVGKPAVFEIHVRNAGTVAANEVEVHDLVPQGTQLIETKPQATRGQRGELTWNLGPMRPGDETVLHVELMPTTEGEIGSVATVRFSAAASARALCTRPELAVDVQAPRRVLAGDDVPLRIRVSNPGTGVATGIVLTEVVPANMTHEAGGELEYAIGDLQPNETRELDLSLRAVKSGPVLNLLHAKGDGKLATEVKTQIEVIAPALTVDVEGPKRRFLDRQATYTVSIANPGTAPAQEVELATYLPRGLQFVDANNNGEYDPQTHSVRWLLEELPPRERGSVSVTMLPVEPGQQLLRIESTALRNVSAQKEEAIIVEGAPSIAFQVVDTADPIEVGGETTYEITVANNGSKEATNVQLAVTLPEAMRAVDAAGPSRHTIAGRQVQFQPLAQLQAKSETKFQVRVLCTAAGDHRCHVQLSSDDSRTPVTKEEGTRVYADE